MAKKEFQLTPEQAEKAIKMCLENAESYLDDADMFVSKNKTDHLAIPIVFAMEEIGKAKIIYDKIENSSSEILLSDKDGIYDHKIKTENVNSLIELDVGEKIAESLLLGDVEGYLVDSSTITSYIRKENELKNTGKQGHGIRLASSYVDFDSVTNDPKIEKSSGDLTELMKNLIEIIHGYYFQGSDSSFHDSMPFDDSSKGLLFLISAKIHSSEQWLNSGCFITLPHFLQKLPTPKVKLQCNNFDSYYSCLNVSMLLYYELNDDPCFIVEGHRT